MSPVRSPKLFWIVAFGLIVLLLGVLFYKKNNQPKLAEDKPSLTVMVKPFHVKPEGGHVRLFGQTVAAHRLDIRAEVSGRVDKIMIADGAFVKAGVAILRFAPESRPFQLAAVQARANQNRLEYEAAQILEKRSFQAKLQVAKSLADLRAVEAEVDRLTREVQRSEVRAPLSGILIKTLPEEGAFVDQGTVVAQVVSLNPLRVHSYVSEQDYANITPETPCQVTLSNGSVHEGKVTLRTPVSENKTHTFLVRVEISNPDQAVPEGMSTTVTIPLPARDIMELPASLLTLNEAGVVGVKTIDSNRIVHFLPVILLSGDHQRVQVSGVPEGALIITRGQEFVLEGQPVDVMEDPTSSLVSSPASSKDPLPNEVSKAPLKDTVG